MVGGLGTTRRIYGRRRFSGWKDLAGELMEPVLADADERVAGPSGRSGVRLPLGSYD